MKRLVNIMVMLLSALHMYAVSAKEDPFEFTHNRFAFNGLLTSSDTYNGISFKRFYPEKSLMQGAYLTATYYF